MRFNRLSKLEGWDVFFERNLREALRKSDMVTTLGGRNQDSESIAVLGQTIACAYAENPKETLLALGMLSKIASGTMRNYKKDVLKKKRSDAVNHKYREPKTKFKID